MSLTGIVNIVISHTITNSICVLIFSTGLKEEDSLPPKLQDPWILCKGTVNSNAPVHPSS